MKPKVLFITKRRGGYAEFSSGLLNSATFVVDMLNKMGITAKIVDVRDNNSIDKEVTEYKPTHVIIEALWVVPSKFDVLKKLHPHVKWIIRLHSDLPFLANEGIAFEWLWGYRKRHLIFVANCEETAAALEDLLNTPVTYLPNYYSISNKPAEKRKHREFNVGCFGAIRPLKNQLLQAVAAIRFADERDIKMNFYINTGRIEMCGAPILKNIRALFKHHPRHELVEIPWRKHDMFMHLLKSMDLGLQVSFSETFNIVTADLVAAEVPTVVSSEVYWAYPPSMADPNSIEDVADKMEYVCANRGHVVKSDKQLLSKANEDSKAAWYKFFTSREIELTWTECILGWCFTRFKRVDLDAL